MDLAQFLEQAAATSGQSLLKGKGWIICEEFDAKTFPFDRMIRGMLDPKMIADKGKIVNKAQREGIGVLNQADVNF